MVHKLSWLARILSCKVKLDKITLREPYKPQDVLNRLYWERLNKILKHRYNRYED